MNILIPMYFSTTRSRMFLLTPSSILFFFSKKKRFKKHFNISFQIIYFADDIFSDNAVLNVVNVNTVNYRHIQWILSLLRGRQSRSSRRSLVPIWVGRVYNWDWSPFIKDKWATIDHHKTSLNRTNQKSKFTEKNQRWLWYIQPPNINTI